MILLQTASDSPWTEDPSIKTVYNNAGYINMYKALDRFEIWVAEDTSSFPTFDHATLYSRCTINSTYKRHNMQIPNICYIGRPTYLSADLGFTAF